MLFFVRRFFIFFSAIVFFILATNVRANPQTRTDTNLGKNYFLRTQYFDIIHSSSSRNTALLISAHADNYAEEICARLNTTVQKTLRKKIPVYIVSNMQELNAYFTAAPYNRIVLYDTTSADGSLANSPDSILTIFYHELTHAVSLNIRSPFWQAISSLFGDIFSPNMFFSMPLSFVEGVTVSFESRAQGGRLNDPLVHHYFSQNKLENLSPTWKQVAGGRRIYPSSTWAYLYGGAFSAYLQKKYGMEYYAKLWHRGGRMGLFRDVTIAQKFKKVYGVSLDAAWQEFISSLPLPATVRENKNFISGQKKGLYLALASSPQGVAWADAESHAVYMRFADGKTKKLFSADFTLRRLSFSRDGNLLLVSRSESIGSWAQNTVRVFDMRQNKFLNEKYFSMRDAAFDADKNYFFAIRHRGQDMQLVRIDRTTLSADLIFSAGAGKSFSSLYNPSYAGEDRIAMLAANGLERKIIFIDRQSKNFSDLPLPKNFYAPRFLQTSFSCPCLTFTFAQKNTSADSEEEKSLYRLAIYNFETHELSWQQEDISGGVFMPTIGEEEKIYYVGIFSLHHSLLEFPSSTIWQKIKVAPQNFSLPTAVSSPIPFDENPPKVYKNARWFVDGIFVPYVNFPTDLKKYQFLAPAFFYTTMHPAENFSFSLNSIFYVKPFFADISMGLTYYLKPAYSFSLLLSDSIPLVFDSPLAYRKSGFSILANFSSPLDVVWRQLHISLQSGFYAFAPRLHSLKNPYQVPHRDLFVHMHLEAMFLLLQKTHFARRPFFTSTQKGLTFNWGIQNFYHTQKKINFPLLQSGFEFYFPVIPVRMAFSLEWAYQKLLTSQGFFYSGNNFSYRGEKSYAPLLYEYAPFSVAYKSFSVIFGFESELFIVTWNIEKSLPAILLYLQNFFITFGYRAQWLNHAKENLYLDSVYTRMMLQMAPFIGGISSGSATLKLEYAYPLRNFDKLKSYGNFRIWFDTQF